MALSNEHNIWLILDQLQIFPVAAYQRVSFSTEMNDILFTLFGQTYVCVCARACVCVF